jgi:hypothetical protein
MYRRVSRVVTGMGTFQREGGGTISPTSPLAAVGFDLQTDRYCKARISAAEEYKPFHQKGNHTT